MTDRILLIGMMGAGKTTVGFLLSQRLGWPLLDSDAQVRHNTGKTVPEIFADYGEATFRAEEARALVEAVDLGRPVVISVAGGAVLDADNRALIRGAGRVVWLRARPGTLADRVGDGEGRPLLGEEPAADLVQLDQVRRLLYEELAELTIDVDDIEADAVAERIQEWMSGTPR